jgi:hypothetical protein
MKTTFNIQLIELPIAKSRFDEKPIEQNNTILFGFSECVIIHRLVATGGRNDRYEYNQSEGKVIDEYQITIQFDGRKISEHQAKTEFCAALNSGRSFIENEIQMINHNLPKDDPRRWNNRSKQLAEQKDKEYKTILTT